MWPVVANVSRIIWCISWLVEWGFLARAVPGFLGLAVYQEGT
jgi:hypothetical protein